MPPSAQEPSGPRDGATPDTGSLLSEADAVALERQIVTLINRERAAVGLSPLRGQSALQSAALGHSAEMHALGYFAHESPTQGRQLMTDRLAEAGLSRYRKAGENIAMISPRDEAAQHFVKLWMESPAHRRNIMDRDFDASGVGIYGGQDGIYATQLFASGIRDTQDAADSAI